MLDLISYSCWLTASVIITLRCKDLFGYTYSILASNTCLAQRFIFQEFSNQQIEQADAGNSYFCERNSYFCEDYMIFGADLWTSTHLNHIFDTSTGCVTPESPSQYYCSYPIALWSRICVCVWVGGWGVALQFTQYCRWMDKLLAIIF